MLLDHAPIHNGFDTRVEFYRRFGAMGGKLVFVPRCCTDQLQPLDVGAFGVFKEKVKAEQLLGVTEGVMEHVTLAWGSAKVKELAVRCVATGMKGVGACRRSSQPRSGFEDVGGLGDAQSCELHAASQRPPESTRHRKGG